MNFSDELCRKVKEMIVAHECQTGNKPLFVQVPVPEGLVIQGVPVKFYLAKHYFSISKDTCMHHYFSEKVE